MTGEVSLYIVPFQVEHLAPLEKEQSRSKEGD